MLIRYFEMGDDLNREKSKLIQTEERDDYSELAKTIQFLKEVHCKDGLNRPLNWIEYKPPCGNIYVSSVDVYLQNIE